MNQNNHSQAPKLLFQYQVSSLWVKDLLYHTTKKSRAPDVIDDLWKCRRKRVVPSSKMCIEATQRHCWSYSSQFKWKQCMFVSQPSWKFSKSRPRVPFASCSHATNRSRRSLINWLLFTTEILKCCVWHWEASENLYAADERLARRDH